MYETVGDREANIIVARASRAQARVENPDDKDHSWSYNWAFTECGTPLPDCTIGRTVVFIKYDSFKRVVRRLCKAHNWKESKKKTEEDAYLRIGPLRGVQIDDPFHGELVRLSAADTSITEALIDACQPEPSQCYTVIPFGITETTVTINGKNLELRLSCGARDLELTSDLSAIFELSDPNNVREDTIVQKDDDRLSIRTGEVLVRGSVVARCHLIRRA